MEDVILFGAGVLAKRLKQPSTPGFSESCHHGFFFFFGRGSLFLFCLHVKHIPPPLHPHHHHHRVAFSRTQRDVITSPPPRRGRRRSLWKGNGAGRRRALTSAPSRCREREIENVCVCVFGMAPKVSQPRSRSPHLPSAETFSRNPATSRPSIRFSKAETF